MKNVFELENPKNARGVYQDIPKSKLIIPEDEYQRTSTSQKRLKRMSEKWDWLMCGAITVVKRGGKYYVVDGGHRVRAAQELNGEIKSLPCMVFETGGKKSEAKGFSGINKLRTSVSTISNHRALLIAGDPLAKRVEKIVVDGGYTVSESGGEWEFSAIGALTRCVKKNDEVAEFAFSVSADIAMGERIYYQALAGIFLAELKHREQNNGKHLMTKSAIAKLSRVGMNCIVRKVNEITAISGSSNGMESGARAVISILNKGCRKKVKVSL